MSSTLTVINRTGNQVCVGIDPSYYYGPSFVGKLANGVLNPGVTSGFVVSGSGPYQVGYLTVLSGRNLLNGSTAHNGVIVYDVYPSSIVTVASELGTRPTSDGAEG